MPYKDPDKQRLFQREYLAKRREAWLSENGPCVICGSAENLEVDHINREEKEDHNVWSWAKARREAELAKCQVLCAVCHNEKTTKENSRPIEHGVYAGYTRGCRCDRCRQAKREYQRARRATGLT